MYSNGKPTTFGFLYSVYNAAHDIVGGHDRLDFVQVIPNPLFLGDYYYDTERLCCINSLR